MPRASTPLMTAVEYAALIERLTPTATRTTPPAMTALAVPRSGRVISLADAPAAPALEAGLTPTAGASTPYRLTQWTDRGDGWTAINDRIEIDVHGAPSMTHIDTVSHFDRDGAPKRGDADALSVLAESPLVGRGILIDVPGVLGESTQGRVITLADVEETLDRTGLTPQAGDALHIHLGRRERARSDIALGAHPTAGLSIECAEWVASLSPSVIVTDEGLDPFPSEVEGVPVPWHLLTLTVLGVPLVDRAMLLPLALACAEVGRWEFLSVIAPLPIPGASGSPVNPIAVL